MKIFSNSVRNSVKWFSDIRRPGQGTRYFSATINKNADPVGAEALNAESKSASANIDLIQFHRKAYAGNFSAGPLLLMNPGLFD